MLFRQMTTPISAALLGVQAGVYRQGILQVPATDSGVVTIGDKSLQTFIVGTTPLYLDNPSPIYVRGTDATDVLDIIAI